MGDLHTRRAELVLARPPAHSLRSVPLAPDPKAQLAEVFEDLRADQGDTLAVVLDLVPITRQRARRHQKRDIEAMARSMEGGSSFWDQLSEALFGHSASTRPQSRGLRRRGELDEERRLADSLTSSDAMFYFQLLIRAQSETPRRAEGLLQRALAAFDHFDGDNEFRVAGRRVPFGFLGSDSLLRRRSFDSRFADASFGAPDTNRVNATEILGLLVPPTKTCRSTVVLRSGGHVAPAPRQLEVFKGRHDQFLLGKVQRGNRSEIVAAPLKDSVFTYTPGRSRFGKTESSLGRWLHLVRSGHGGLFLDPHADALQRAKPFLVDHADRVVELAIAQGGQLSDQVGWNPFAISGMGSDVLEPRLRMILDGIATALGWGSNAPRASTLAQMAIQSLLELALQLPPKLAPTMFQITTILTSESWREQVVPHLSPHTRMFWNDSFSRYPPDATTPVTNFLYRLRIAPSLAALFGSPRSTYDLRKAMDQRQIVLVRLSGTGDLDRLVASLVMFDLLNAALSRWTLPPEDRHEFHVFCDEVQAYDRAVAGQVQALLEQTAKYGVRLHLLNQAPGSLSESTRRGIFTNCSHLFAANLDEAGAKLVANNMGDKVSPQLVTELPKYRFLSKVTHDGKVSAPFRLDGVSLDELWPNEAQRCIDGLEKQIAVNSGRQPIRATLGRLEDLDFEIAAYLAQKQRPAPGNDVMHERVQSGLPEGVVPIKEWWNE